MVTLQLFVDVPIELYGEVSLEDLSRVSTSQGAESFLVTAANVCLSLSLTKSPAAAAAAVTVGTTTSTTSEELENNDNNRGQQHSTKWAAFFLSPTLTESVLADFRLAGNRHLNVFCSEDQTLELSRRLLTMIHPFLAHNFAVRGVLSIQNLNHCPADIVLLDLLHTPLIAIDQMLQITSGATIHSGPEAICKAVLLSHISFQWESQSIQSPSVAAATSAPRTRFDIPSCPVCLHRIDPRTLGLPAPQTNQLCSKFCTPPTMTSHNFENPSCRNQRLLRPWPSPCRCSACITIDRHWKTQIHAIDRGLDHRDCLSCFQCGLQETLWVCLTCAFVGCGRYSNRHSVEHFDETGHPFSLELATLRIWDYARGDFSHRTDFLDCPSSPPVLFTWNQNNARRWFSEKGQVGGGDLERLKSPIKASLIGEEYEALILSALEEQAEHYQGEIMSLTARITEDNVDKNTMSSNEAYEIKSIQAEIAVLHSEIDRANRELVDWQEQEARHRATYENLLREQQVAQDLLKSIKEEVAKERAKGNLQMEELRQQIEDLTTNQQMRYQFSMDEELQHAQIWGMSSDQTDKKGKKGKRWFRK